MVKRISHLILLAFLSSCTNLIDIAIDNRANEVVELTIDSLTIKASSDFQE